MRIVGLIQARMGSTRLPGKVLMNLGGRSVVGHILDRLVATTGVDGCVLATTVAPANDALEAFAEAEGIGIYRSALEDDIADRLYGAAQKMQADAILKVNGDCPFVCPSVMGRLVEEFQHGGYDYVSNKIRPTWPEGLSAEVIATPALAWADAALTRADDREFVANLIRDSRDRFAVGSVEGDEDFSNLKLSLDTPEDFAEAERLAAALYPANPLFLMDDIAGWLSAAPSRAAV
jgi:spore coat polysaccharide biosynthesis protein SpsF